MSSPVLIHATTIVLDAMSDAFDGPKDGGVLLLGPSGSGKSDVALRMIAAGAKLLSDDQTLIFARNGHVMALAPEQIRGLLEARGIGILRTPAPLKEAPILLAVALLPDHPIERMPEPAYFSTPANLGETAKIPQLMLNPFEISTPVKIAAAACAAAHGTLFSQAL